MRKIMVIALGIMFLTSTASTTLASTKCSFKAVKTTDMPDYPDNDNDGGPYTDPEPTPDPGPDSTDSGDSWDSGSSGGGFDGGDYGGTVLF